MPFIITLALVVILAGFWYWKKNQSLSQNEIDDAKKRIEDLQNRSKTQFFATPDDDRLKENMEYVVALKKRDQQEFSLTFFDMDGISSTELDVPEEDLEALEAKGWKINGQRFTREGVEWQLERSRLES